MSGKRIETNNKSILKFSLNYFSYKVQIRNHTE